MLIILAFHWYLYINLNSLFIKNERLDLSEPNGNISDFISKMTIQDVQQSAWKRAEFCPDDLLLKKPIPDLFRIHNQKNTKTDVEIDEEIFESVFDMRLSIASSQINQLEFKNLIENFVECFLKGYFRNLDLAMYFYKDFTLLYSIVKKTKPFQLLRFLEIKNSFSKQELAPLCFVQKGILKQKVIYRTLLSGFVVENYHEIETKNICAFQVIQKLVLMGITTEHENNNALILTYIDIALNHLNLKKRSFSY